MDRFFDVAPTSARSILISQIAQIWEKRGSGQEDEKTIQKVLRIWERRYAEIDKQLSVKNTPADLYDGELTESLDFLNCECFPFEWRFKYSKFALYRVKRVRQAYRLLDTIVQFGSQRDRLEPVLELLKAALSKPSDELRWSIQPKKLETVISLGFASDKPTTSKLAADCKDLLLRMGFSDLLNL